MISADPESERATLDDRAAGGGDRLTEREDEDVLLQPYTPGTTGDPKGVLLTHRNFRVQIVDSVVRYTTRTVEGESLIVLPTYHNTGLLRLLSGLAAGGTVRMLRPDRWDPDLVLRTLDEHDVPVFTGMAAMFTDRLEAYEADPREYDLGSLRRAGQGSDKLSHTVHERFEETLDVPLSERYGLTETTAGTHAVRVSTLGDRVGSVGQPFGHTDSKVVDADGEAVPTGEEGEILVRGPQVMAGYYDDPGATDETFTEDGYLRTGDRDRARLARRRERRVVPRLYAAAVDRNVEGVTLRDLGPSFAEMAMAREHPYDPRLTVFGVVGECDVPHLLTALDERGVRVEQSETDR